MRRRLIAVCSAALLTVSSAGGVAAQDAADPSDDPALEQRIDAGQALVSGRAELAAGHVDLGPRFVDGAWRLLVHDDSAESSVWRDPADVVLRVGDAGRRRAPSDEAYDFLGARPGSDVWVISQTEIADVVWLGWNTQDPEVMDRVDRGVTLTLLDSQGPGQVSLYLQSGTFGAPDVLWRSTDRDPGEIWVDTNTHTHANWVFTEPGTYLIRVGATAETGGEPLGTTADLRVVVGGPTDVGIEEAFAADWSTPPRELSDAVPATARRAAPEVPDSEEAPEGASTWWIGLLAAVVVAATAVAVVRRRSLSVRRAGMSER